MLLHRLFNKLLSGAVTSRAMARKIFIVMALSVGLLSVFASTASTASAATPITTCKTIPIHYRGTHLVFLWRVIPAKRVIERLHDKNVVRVIPRHKVHLWHREIRSVHGKRVQRLIPVKVRRAYVKVEHESRCTTTPAPTTTTALTTTPVTTTTPTLTATPVTTTPVTTTTAPTTTPAPTATLLLNTNTLPATGGSITLDYSATNASTCTLFSSPALWPGANPATVSCAGSYSATLSSSTSGGQWNFIFSATSSDGRSATSTQVLTEQVPPFAQSPNWSGYVVPSASSLITEASGEWIVPTLDCAATPNSGVSTWVGIGGWSWPTGGTSGALLQTGVTDNCVNGVQQDSAWWEEVPSSPNQSSAFTSFPVSSGDVIEASVYQTSSGAWETSVDDLTTGLTGIMVTGEGWGVSTGGSGGSFTEQGSTADLSYLGGYTAEWIVEDYQQGGIGGAYVPFANYGTVTFTNLTTSLSPWSLTPGEGVEIVQNGTVLSEPSFPSNSGFSVSYTG